MNPARGAEQTEPLDLRLVPPALVVWLTAAVTLTVPGHWVVALAVTCGVAGIALLVPLRRTAGRPGRRAWRRPSAAVLLLCVAAAALSAGLHGAELRRGPVPELADRYARVEAELEVTADPRVSRPRVTGDHQAPTIVLIEADLVRVTATDGTVERTRAPVLALVEGRGSAWLSLLPSTRIRVEGSLAPPLRDGDRIAAVLRVRQQEGVRERRWRTGQEARASQTGQADPTGQAGPTGRADLTGQAGPTGRAGLTGQAGPTGRAGPTGQADLTGRADVTGQAEQDGPRIVAPPSRPQRLAATLRAGLREATAGLPEDARALLPGLVVGDTARVTPELHAAFQATDMLHLLAVSGANFTILLALLIGPPGTAHLVERRGLAPRVGLSLRMTALLGGALTLGFAVVCRPEPSVLRAAACGAVALLAIATGRRRSLIPALATAVLVLVLYDPWLARSYGFLLSVLATGALLTLAPRWSAGLRRRGVPARLAEALGAAAAAQAVCAPVVAVLAARVSLVAVPCNLLAEFAVAPATVLGFAALAAAPVAMPVAEFFAWCAGWPAGWIAGIARTGAALPGNGVDWPGGWRGGALLAVATVVAVLVGRRVLKSAWLVAACAVLLLLAVVQPPPLTRVITGWPPPGWRMVMCDVGQGDALVLAAGAGTGVVVDAGPDPVPVDRCLRALGITKVPLLLFTHFHADHVAGLPGVLRGRSVGAIGTTGLQEPVDQVAFVRRLAARRGVPVVRAAAGERRRAGPLTWEVLWPPPRPVPEPDGPNDASITLLVRTAGLTLLLLGDLEPPAQRALLRTADGARLSRVDVLKVAHHGSAFQDPELLRRVAPRLALISCGADNPYGHPAPRTVEALRQGGAAVLRTDQDGAVAVVGRGKAGGPDGTGGPGLEVAHTKHI